MSEAQQPDHELCVWFDLHDGFKQGTDAPHKWVLQANSEIGRLHARVQELEAQLARKVPTKEELADYLMQKDAVIVARKTYEAMRGLTPLRKVDA